MANRFSEFKRIEPKNRFSGLGPSKSRVKNTTLGDVADAFQSGLFGGAADTAQGVTLGNRNFASDFLRGKANEQIETMSPEALRAMRETGFNDDLSLKEDSSAFGAALLGAQGLGSFAPSFIPGLGASKVLQRVSGVSKALKKGGQISSAVQKKKRIADAAGFGFGGAALIGGGTANEAYNEAINADFESLVNIPEFKQAVQDVQNKGVQGHENILNEAREQYAQSKGREAFKYSAPIGAVSMGLSGPVLERVIAGRLATSRLGNTGVGAGTEALQEFYESGGQKLVANKIAQEHDPSRDLLEGVVGEAATGAAIGAGVGGGLGAATGGALTRAAEKSGVDVSQTVNQVDQSAPDDGRIIDTSQQIGGNNVHEDNQREAIGAGVPDNRSGASTQIDDEGGGERTELGGLAGAGFPRSDGLLRREENGDANQIEIPTETDDNGLQKPEIQAESEDTGEGGLRVSRGGRKEAQYPGLEERLNVQLNKTARESIDLQDFLGRAKGFFQLDENTPFNRGEAENFYTEAISQEEISPISDLDGAQINQDEIGALPVDVTNQKEEPGIALDTQNEVLPDELEEKEETAKEDEGEASAERPPENITDIKKAIKAAQELGHSVIDRPRKKMVSISGFPDVSYEEGVEKINNLIMFSHKRNLANTVLGKDAPEVSKKEYISAWEKGFTGSFHNDEFNDLYTNPSPYTQEGFKKGLRDKKELNGQAEEVGRIETAPKRGSSLHSAPKGSDEDIREPGEGLEPDSEADLRARDSERKERERKRKEDEQRTGQDRQLAAQGGQLQLTGSPRQAGANFSQSGIFDLVDRMNEEDKISNEAKADADTGRRGGEIRDKKPKVRNVKTGELRTGITQVNSPSDALHIIAPIRKSAQEQMVAIVLDNKNNVLQVIKHSVGLSDSSQVDVGMLAGAIHGVDGASSVYFAHNHPSGNTEQSQSDKQVTGDLTSLLKDTGVKPMGMIVTVPGKAGSFYKTNGGASDISASTARRNKAVPLTERNILKASRVTKPVSSPDEAIDAVKLISGGKDGIILLNNAHEPVSFVEMTPSAMSELRTGEAGSGASMLLREIHETNARAMIAVLRNEDAISEKGVTKQEEAFRNIGTFAENTKKTRMLDAIVGGQSAAARGQSLFNPGTDFFSKQVFSLPAHIPHHQAGRIVKSTVAKLSGLKIDVRMHDNQQDSPFSGESGRVEAAIKQLDDGSFELNVISGNIKDADSLRSILLEEVTHAGLRNFLGGREHRKLMDVVMGAAKSNADFKGAWESLSGRTADGKAIDENAPYFKEDDNAVADEVISKLARDGIDNSLLKRIYSIVAQFMRKIGLLKGGLTKAEAQGLIARAYKSSRDGQSINGSADEAQRFSVVPAARSLFDQWFSGSKMKRGGNPIPFYRGDNAAVTEFEDKFLGSSTKHPSSGLGHFFTGDKEHAIKFGSNVQEVFLSIKKPFVINSEMMDDKFSDIDGARRYAAKLKSQGYDGVYIKDAGYAVAFESKQVKLTSNKEPTMSRDIRFSRAGNDAWRSQSGYEGLSNDTFDTLSKFGEPTGLPKTEKIKERYKELKILWKNKLRQGFVDQYESIRSILKDDTAWMMAQTVPSAGGAVEQALETGHIFLDKSGAVDVDGTKKSLSEIVKPLGDEVDRFLQWIAGNRAEGLKTEGRENLLSDDDIKILKSLADNDNGKLWGERRKTYEKAREELESLHNSVVQIGVDTGLVSRKDAALWKDQGFYIPFYRLAEKETDRKGPTSIGGLVKQEAYKRLKGADIPLNDLQVNLLMNWSHLLGASLKNQAAVKSLRTAANMGLAKRVESLSDDGSREIKKNKKSRTDRSVFVRKNGRKIWYTLDDSPESDLVLDSLMALNWEGMNNFAMKAMRKFKRALTIGVVASPEFKIANLVRDSIQAIAVSDMSVNIAQNVAGGWKLTKDGNLAYARAKAGGGVFGDSGYVYGGDPDALKLIIARDIEKNTVLDTRSKIRKLWDKYQDFGARLENLNRIKNFEDTLEKTGNLLLANFSGRDHLDFQRTGSFPAVRILTQTVPFLNARLQGLDKLARAASDPDQKKQFYAVVGTYALASMSLYLLMKDDDDYKEAEEWERDTYHLFKIPGSDLMYRLPRPFEVGAIGAMAERAIEQAVDDDVHGGLFAERLGHALSETLALGVMPQAFKPAVELWGNRNTFTDRPIESLSMKGLSAKERKKAWTSQTAIGLSQGMDAILWEDVTLSPVQIEHLVNGYLGWAGAFTLGAIDTLFSRQVSGAPSAPDRRIEDFPVIGRFVREGDARSSKYLSSFYNNLGDINRAYADIRRYRDLKDEDKYKKALEENKDKLKHRKRFNRAQRILNKINKQIQAVTRGNLPDSVKRERIDELFRKRNKITRSVVNALRG